MASGPTITAKFLADTSDLTSGVDSATSKAGGKMSSFAKTAAVAVGGAFVADKVVDFSKASIDAAAADAEAQAQLAAALKNTAGASDAQIASTEDWITKQGKVLGIADDDLRPALAVLARGFGDVDAATEVSTLAMDIAAGTGKDLVSVSEALAKANNGQLGPLKKLDPALGALIKSGASTDEVFSTLSQTFKGQASVAAESTAGQMRKAKIAMGEMQETIGSALLPAIGALAGFLNNTLFPALTTAFGWLMDHKEVLVAALIGIGAVLIPLFISWAASAAVAAAATLLAAAPFILIGLAVAALAYLIITNWDTIVASTKAAWAFVSDTVSGAWDSIQGAALAVWDWIQNTWSTVTGYITAPIQTAVDTVSNIIGTISDTFSTVVDDIEGFFSTLADAITGAFKTAFNAVAGLFNSTLGGFGFTTPSLFGHSVSFHIPEMPTLATGGLLTSDGLVFAHAGEVIAPIEKVPGFGGPTVHIEYAQFNDPVDVELLAKHLEFALSAGLSM